MDKYSCDDVNNLIDVIKTHLKQTIDNQYTEYKNKCLQDLEYTLEAKRNESVKGILDGIDVVLANNEYSMEPNIFIKIEKKVILNNGDKYAKK